MNTSVQASRHAKKHINTGCNATLPYEDSKIICINYIGSGTPYTVSDEQRNSIVTDKFNSQTQHTVHRSAL